MHYICLSWDKLQTVEYWPNLSTNIKHTLIINTIWMLINYICASEIFLFGLVFDLINIKFNNRTMLNDQVVR